MFLLYYINSSLFLKNNIKKNQLTDLGFILTPNLLNIHIFMIILHFLAFCTLIFYNQILMK